jgi:UDP-glucose 4-epimerase
LVTGGAGFIGHHLVRRLLGNGIAVSVLDDLSMGQRQRVDPAARFIEGDIRSPEAVREALAGVDCVFHLAARVTIRGSFESFYDDMDINLMGTANILRELPASNVRHFSLASSMAVYADCESAVPVPESHTTNPIAPYGVSKLAAERLCAQMLATAGIRFSALRYFNTYGPGQTFTPYVGVITIFINRLLAGEPPILFGDGEQRRDFVHVDDIVAGTVATLAGEPGIYNLGTGRDTSVRELAQQLLALLGPERTVEYAAAQEGELRNSIADVSAARRGLGYRPTRRLAEELPELVEMLRAAVR